MMFLAYLAALAAAPQAAPAPSSDAQVIGAIKQLDAASQGVEAVQAELGPLMQKAIANVRASGDANALAREIRPTLARYRAALQATSARIGAVQPVTFPAGLPYDFARLQSEGRAQVDGLRELVEALDAMIVAVAAKDKAAMEAPFATIARSGVTLIQGQAVILRRRQLAVPTDESTHQSLGITANFYEVMVPIMAAIVNAKPTGEPAAARFARLAADTRALNVAGRANVVRELAEVDEAPAAERAALRTVFALENETFALGDRLAAKLDEFAAKPLTQQSARAAQPEMAAIENEFSAISRRQVQAVPGAPVGN
jgi:hypothetical protein